MLHRISAPTFGQLHSMRGAMVAPTKIIAGLGASLSMQLLSCPRATGDYRSDFAAKVPSELMVWQLFAAPLPVLAIEERVVAFIDFFQSCHPTGRSKMKPCVDSF
jgi:hypothetical protein